MHEHIQNEINKLMQKDMDRRDFLKHVGIGFAGLLGVTSAVKALSHLNGSQTRQSSSSVGYGSSAYGGNAKRTNG
jgi:hypothetical protein